MTRLLSLALVLLGACSASPRRPAPQPDRASLITAFEQQFSRSADTWNRGDLDAFVSDYANDSVTSFGSGGPLHRGYDWMLTARYILFHGGRTTASGPFTLVMERRPDGWKILHDHTSSDAQ